MKKEHKINVQAIKDKNTLKKFTEELGKGKNGKRNALLFSLGIYTGLRVSDLIKIKVSDVKNRTEFTIKEQKTGKQRKVYLHAVLTELTDYLSKLSEDDVWLFPNTWDKSKHITSNQFYKILQKTADGLGLDYVGTHTMRKSFGYHYYKEYKDIATLMTIFNHANPKTTLSYIGITDEEIKNTLKDFKIF